MVFYGLKDLDSEDCEEVVKDSIANKLQISIDDMIIDRSQRLGSTNARKPRPIVTKFHRYTEREAVKQQANSAELKPQLRDAGLSGRSRYARRARLSIQARRRRKTRQAGPDHRK